MNQCQSNPSLSLLPLVKIFLSGQKNIWKKKKEKWKNLGSSFKNAKKFPTKPAARFNLILGSSRAINTILFHLYLSQTNLHLIPPFFYLSTQAYNYYSCSSCYCYNKISDMIWRDGSERNLLLLLDHADVLSVTVFLLFCWGIWNFCQIENWTFLFFFFFFFSVGSF